MDTTLSLLISAGIIAFGVWVVAGTIAAGSPLTWTLNVSVSFDRFCLTAGFTDGQDFLDSEIVKGGGCEVAIIHRFSKLSAASALRSARLLFA
jgi:hypothetical protein